MHKKSYTQIYAYLLNYESLNWERIKNSPSYKISIRIAFTRCLLEMWGVIFRTTDCLVFSRQFVLSWRHFSRASNLGRGQWVALVQWEAAASTPAINHGSDRYLTADDGCPCIVNGALISAPPPTLKGGAFIQPSGSSIMDGFSKP